MSSKTVTGVLIEAVIVGVSLIAFYFLSKTVSEMVMSVKFTTLNTQDYILLFFTGALFHLVFEYTGLNVWYSKDYCKLL